MRHFGEKVNYDPNGVVTIRNREVGYKIHRDKLPGRIMQFQRLKEAGWVRNVEFYYIGIYNNSGYNYKPSGQYRATKNSG